MDKNAIKKYAVWARRELISRVSQKAMQYGITDIDIVSASAASVNGVVLSAEEMSQRKALIVQIEAKGYEQVMEEVAYTWFNRFIALRFMEVNGYLPSRVRVFTDENNAFKPQILAEAINLDLEGLDMDKVYALKDANNDDALFKYLVITQCNALNSILPGMFQRIADYTELLFPDNLLREGSAIEQMISMIPEEDWKDAVQIIGWLYQYYNSEKKDEVFAALKKNVKITKENIPAATQLFTPDWIVRYMVENSLGRLWVEGHPNDELRAGWKYYLDEAEQEPAIQAQLAAIRKEYADITPETIKCIDPCAGSGHILAYMFDVLFQIYEAYGYTAREAVRNIIENNIYGLDIDDRAAQLAYFAVMMKARQYDRRFLTRKDENGSSDVPQPHVYAILESNGIDNYALEYFINDDPKLKTAMDSIITDMYDAKEYGSILNITPVDYAVLNARFEEIREEINISRDAVLNEILPLVQVAHSMSQQYDAVITNPPYMSGSGMADKLLSFVQKNYKNEKADIYACFITKALNWVKKHGFVSMITMETWMFLNSMAKMRASTLACASITNMVHMPYLGKGGTSLGINFGTAAYILRKEIMADYNAEYVYIRYYECDENGVPFIFPTENERHCFAKQSDYSAIPASPIAYWVSSALSRTFSNDRISSKAISDGQTKTGDNNKFLRFLWEVSNTNIGRQKKWAFIAKGGNFRRWYGNIEYVIDWSDKARQHYRKDHVARIAPEYIWFREGVSWNHVTSIERFAARYLPADMLFETAAPSVFFNDTKTLYWVIGYLNSFVSEKILKLVNPTMCTNVGDITVQPMITGPNDDRIVEIVKDNIGLSKADWDSYETSWNFQQHPLIGRHGGKVYRSHDHGNVVVESPYKIKQWDFLLSSSFESWKKECDYRFTQLKANEEQLNGYFINTYGLQDEITPEVEDNDVTVSKADLKRDIKSLISYAVGCMFGRYSLDIPGLAYAGGEWDESKYITFEADKDNIIPICDDEYFADDIVGRFVRFIEVAFGKATLDENLRFIADALGGSGQPKDVIRNYFMDEFYADHLKTYQKRPIYWLFDSGKKGGFRALVYMHRYQPDTIARMRTDYVHEQQSRYRTAIADLEQRISSASTSERVKLSKRLKTLQEQAAEIQGYEEKIHHLADQYIAIDLDDGVKKNYEIFKDVLAKIK